MAKKINTDTDRDIRNETVNTPEDEKEEAIKASAAQAQVSATESTSPFIDAILRSFKNYDSLYIDSHGGTYTATTPKVIRGDAVLYKNPYYKS